MKFRNSFQCIHVFAFLRCNHIEMGITTRQPVFVSYAFSDAVKPAHPSKGTGVLGSQTGTGLSGSNTFLTPNHILKC